ncbi:MAG TPA: hypothetical protein VGQ83_06040 [Polyangia bacterium]|jgi:hypothetical protein
MKHATRMLLLAALALPGCGDNGGSNLTCNPDTVPTGCSGDFQCEVLTGATGGRCYQPAYLLVKVMNSTNGDAAIAGARVVAIDGDTNAAAAPAAITASDGTARIAVTWPRAQPDTEPSHAFTLRVSARGYYDYPGAMRIAIPVSVQRDPVKGLAPTNAEVRLIPMAQPLAGGIAGTVLESDGRKAARGVLVVAETSDVPPIGYTSVSDGNGAFEMLNVAAGTYTISGYFAGMSFPQSSVSVSGGPVRDLKLVADATPNLATVSGQVNIVAGGGATTTTVVLRTRSTKDVPPGLRVTATSGAAFQITGVPTGTYEAVAAYGNDGLVLDPDTNTAGTQIQEIAVVGTPTGATYQLDHAFKVTGAVQILSPGATGTAELVSGAPVFRWKAYAQADHYKLALWDGIHPAPVWTIDNITTESFSYDDPSFPALDDGFIYQWTVEAWAVNPTARPLSRSEDQLGVFQYRAPAH